MDDSATNNRLIVQTNDAANVGTYTILVTG